MSMLFTAKKGAQLPAAVLTLTASVAFDLTTASVVNFVYQPEGGSGRTVVPLTVLSASTARLDLTSGLVAAAGIFDCQVEATFGGQLMVFPQLGFYQFQVTGTLE